MSIDPHTRKYHSKKCPDCRKRIGTSYERCGECDEKRKLEALAFSNGVELIKARNQARYLSAEHKKNIGDANKRKAKQAGDNSIKPQ